MDRLLHILDASSYAGAPFDFRVVLMSLLLAFVLGQALAWVYYFTHSGLSYSKSFVQSLAEALADELRDTGVTVTSLMPGPTDTDFFRRAGLDGTLLARSAVDDPATVAAQGYAAMMKGRTAVVGGSPWVKAQAAVNGLLPDQVKAAAHRVFTSVLPRT